MNSDIEFTNNKNLSPTFSILWIDSPHTPLVKSQQDYLEDRGGKSTCLHFAPRTCTEAEIRRSTSKPVQAVIFRLASMTRDVQ